MPNELPTKLSLLPKIMLPLIDTFDRVHRNLRISVTDRCNIRCFYCMPEHVEFLPPTSVLSFEEITRVAHVAAMMGVNRVRLTGGEPLVRSQLHKLVTMLRRIDGIEEIAMTTNGILLADQAALLREAGLDRLNISLDTIDAEKFEQITRRRGLEKVLAGIEAAQAAGFERIRINAVSIAGLTDQDVLPLAQFCRDKSLELRFIEFMPVDGDQQWDSDQVLSGERIRSMIGDAIGTLSPAERANDSQPAIDYEYVDGTGRVGFINPVSQPFCGSCDRLRLTAEGKIRNCLFSHAEWDVRSILRGSGSDAHIEQRIRESITAKLAGHGMADENFQRPQRAMYQIGG